MVDAMIAPNGPSGPIEIFRNIAPDSAAALLGISAADLARLSHSAAHRITPKLENLIEPATNALRLFSP